MPLCRELSEDSQHSDRIDSAKGTGAVQCAAEPVDHAFSQVGMCVSSSVRKRQNRDTVRIDRPAVVRGVGARPDTSNRASAPDDRQRQNTQHASQKERGPQGPRARLSLLNLWRGIYRGCAGQRLNRSSTMTMTGATSR